MTSTPDAASLRPELARFARPQRFSAFGYAVVLLTFGVFGGWAATAKIDSATVAPGIVSLEGNRKVVQHLEGGIIRNLHVREADTVSEGDVLITLESVEARSNLERYRARLREAQAVEARLMAEQAFADEIDFPADLLSDASPDLAATLRIQREILADRLGIYRSQRDILQFRIDQLEGQRAGLTQQRDALERRLALRQGVVDRLTRGAEQGVIENNLLDERRDTLIQIEAALGEVTSEIAQAGVALSEAQLNLLKLDQEFAERATVELNEIRQQLAELRESLKVARDTFERTEIRAPSDGVVQALQVTTEGSVIRSGDVLMEIVPQDDTLLVSARVAPIDIDNVRPGQETEVRFVSFNTKLTPVVLGTVDSVSRDVITPEANGQEPYYLARVRVPEENMTDDIRQGLTPGMPADVVIVNGERSVMSYLISPLVDAIAVSLREE